MNRGAIPGIFNGDSFGPFSSFAGPVVGHGSGGSAFNETHPGAKLKLVFDSGRSIWKFYVGV